MLCFPFQDLGIHHEGPNRSLRRVWSFQGERCDEQGNFSSLPAAFSYPNYAILPAYLVQGDVGYPCFGDRQAPRCQ